MSRLSSACKGSRAYQALYSYSQICLTSYSPEVVGVHDTSWSSMQEKEANVTSLNESFNMDQRVSDRIHEAGEPESVSPKTILFLRSNWMVLLRILRKQILLM